MLINVPLRLLALLPLVVASGCSHLPSLSSVNHFSASNPAVAGPAIATPIVATPIVATPTEVVVIESTPIEPITSTTSPQTSHLIPQVTEPRATAVAVGTLENTGLVKTKPLMSVGSLADSREALAQRLQSSNRNANYSAKAVVLGDTQGVLDLPPSYWAVQIAAVKNIERVAEMVKDNQLDGLLGVPMNTEAGPLHAVLTGVFVKREDAQASAENLPPALAGYEPWVRPLAHLQAAMR